MQKWYNEIGNPIILIAAFSSFDQIVRYWITQCTIKSIKMQRIIPTNVRILLNYSNGSENGQF